MTAAPAETASLAELRDHLQRANIGVRDHGTRIARGSAGGDVLVWPIEEMT